MLGDLNLDRRRPDKREGKLLIDLEMGQGGLAGMFGDINPNPGPDSFLFDTLHSVRDNGSGKEYLSVIQTYEVFARI